MSQMRTEAGSDKQVTEVSERWLAVLWIAIVGAVVLHNTEEWLLNMTGWIADHPWFPGRSLHGDQSEFAIALIVVTVAVLLLGGSAVAIRPRWSTEVLVCVAYALMINGASHAVASLVSWSVMPGVITGVLVLIPCGVLVIHMLPPVRWTMSSVIVTVIAAVGITAGAFALASVVTGMG